MANDYLVSPPSWGSSDLTPTHVQLPKEVFGRTVEWECAYRPNSIFMVKFRLDQSFIYLFGSRLDLCMSTIGFAGWINVFTVVGDRLKATHELASGRSPVYVETGQEGAWVWAAAQKKRLAASTLYTLPQWKWSDAQWPTCKNEPMLFLGQVSLPEEPEPCSLGNGRTFYLFVAATGDDADFAITEQENTFQSADDHYQKEGNKTNED